MAYQIVNFEAVEVLAEEHVERPDRRETDLQTPGKLLNSNQTIFSKLISSEFCCLLAE